MVYIYVNTRTGVTRPGLCLHLQGHAELVAGLVELGAIQQGGQGHGDAGPQALLVAQTNLARVINLCSNAGIITKVILAANAEVGVAGSRGVDCDTSLEAGLNLVVDTTTEHLSIISGDVENHVVGGIAEGQVVLHNSGLAGVEGSAVAKSPGSVADAGAAVDDGASGQAQVAVHQESLVFVL